jgi:hypothetical protein
MCIHTATQGELDAAKTVLDGIGPQTPLAPAGSSPGLPYALHYTVAGGACNPPCGSFSPERFFSLLHTETLGRVLLTAGEVQSTQAVVQAGLTKLPDGIVFVADRQMGGKGRCRKQMVLNEEVVYRQVGGRKGRINRCTMSSYSSTSPSRPHLSLQAVAATAGSPLPVASCIPPSSVCPCQVILFPLCNTWCPWLQYKRCRLPPQPVWAP